MRLRVRAAMALVCASIAGACATPYVAVPLAAHPSAATTGPSVGASAGGVFGTAEDSNLISVPYSEGWLRTQAGAGQLDFHMGPGVGSLGYRFDLQPLAAGFGFAVEPFGGGGYYRVHEDVGDATSDDSAYTLVLAGGLRFHILIPSGDNFFYISPALGITHIKTDQSDTGDIDDLVTLGTALGMNLGGRPGISVELTVHRLSPSDDFDTDLWIFGPSVGFQI